MPTETQFSPSATLVSGTEWLVETAPSERVRVFCAPGNSTQATAIALANVGDISEAQQAELIQRDRKAALHAHRDRLIAAGTTVVVTGIGDVPLRGSPFDQTVMLSLLQRGAARVAASDTTADILFRDDDNTDHLLTGEQAVELAEAGMAWVQAVMQSSWAIKDAGDIPEDFDDTVYWSS
ncbi:DUF4376 domain-containing protein [Salipiger bermudensis]|uniref:DUF4376 domain-containing protein n=1 Tax=Salipiger bermudensis (strain DSM 26914 / JCM 13377 / KCTC 12554 / HTCC2601) TaxID=314265 RepID=Q0FH95_SALBH|nr:hypothetical protein [Salipiger bermudensis]EAU43556.1 hypothetical protein R2601_24045 [Salipiger bermudensis HTCC2601]